MEFRPCIDIHNGKVKQIVGSSLLGRDQSVVENFISGQDSVFYANIYKKMALKGGHVIMLNTKESAFYQETQNEAMNALRAYPGGLQVGGGITPQNAAVYLDAGASHVIVTSYVFSDGQIHYDHLNQMVKAVGRKHLVVDLSCRQVLNQYYIVTDKWQKNTGLILSEETMELFTDSCDEFLIHAVDMEGKVAGIDERLAAFLGNWEKNPITYAGGVHSFEDLKKLKMLGKNRVHVTIGSALDLFGGVMKLQEVLSFIRTDV